MTKFAFTALMGLAVAAAAPAIAAPALAGTPLAFTWEGHKIVGTVSQSGTVQIIAGKDLTTGEDFELHVKNGYVTGSVGSQFVSYPVPKRKLRTTTTG